MSYIVLARKHRPQTFDEVVGQTHITDLLKKSIETNHLSHAYLFCGPRGIGKTSCARILAKSLNCQKGPTSVPCGKCASCLEIAAGTSFDVIEIDGASNRGIDEIRTLRENVKFAPSYGRYKIYIVDEVHMLTTEAFNALLKTLEEPPEYVKFIFATTEPHKVLPTIVSRCQKYDFKRVSVKTISQKLEDIAKAEDLKIDADAIYAIAKAATGSLRDALSVLDQLSALSAKTIKASDVVSMLGLVETEFIFELTDAVAEKNCVKCFEVLDKILNQGKDIKQLLRNIVEHYRHLMIIKIGGKDLSKLVDYPVSVKELLIAQSAHYTLEEILKAIDIFVEVQEVAKIMDSFQIPLEVAFAKLTFKSGEVKKEPMFQEKKIPPVKIAAVERFVNQKGHLDFSLDHNIQTPIQVTAVGEPLEKEEVTLANIEPLTLEQIRKGWDAITSAISRERMSVATYLQEGMPCLLKGTVLTIGFPHEAKFHKEALEDKDTMNLITRVVDEKFKQLFRIELKLTDDFVPQEHGAAVKNTLEKFHGKVVNKWHREGGA
ncbi:MAG: DNA polymerase III subunit gamma/tau [Candidatus Omnitrophota bacterium]